MVRHEKIVLVVLGYIIGFTTAYIAFGITPDVNYDDDYSARYTHEPQHPSSERRSDSTHTDDAKANSNIDIILTEDGMFAEIEGEEKVISGKLYDGVTIGPGFHVDIPRYEPSPDGKYVYYCEQQSTTENVCHEYLYLVQEHLIKPLKAQGELLTSAISDSGFKWMREGVLASPKFVSLTPETPWELKKR